MKWYPTTEQLIRERIDRLHEKGSGDWQSLMRQANDAYKPIRYNIAQIMAISVLQTVKELDLEWGRGTGKTTIMATFARRISTALPRGSFQWLVPSYQKFLTEIIPAWIHSMEMQGYHSGLHYFIGRRPPSSWNWPEPYKPPIRYDNCIYFYNGFIFQLLSQDIPGSGRGLSTDGEFADEVAMLDRRKMEENSNPSIRGSNVRAFKNNRWFNFRLKASSTPLVQEGAWFTEREKAAMERPLQHQFHRFNCVNGGNLGNLKEGYLEDARRDAVDETTFLAEYMNIRPRFVRGGFYALLTQDRHTYVNFDYGHYANRVGLKPDCKGDADRIPTLPLILGVDFGAAINSMLICQYLPNVNEFRALKNVYAKGAEGKTQDDMCEAFCQYYAPHTTKEIQLWYDATGNHATGNTKLSKAQQIEQYLAARGWTVRRMQINGTNPRHFEKYRLWERILSEDTLHLPRFRINRENARECYISMSNARSFTTTDKQVKKNKSSERHDNPRRELATDLSDALDQPVFGMFNHMMQYYGSPLPQKS